MTSNRRFAAFCVASLLGMLLGNFAQAHAAPANGDFLVGCSVHTISQDDPIKFPGQPGAAHTHAFAGAFPVDAFTTFGSVVNTQTSCKWPELTSVAWTPVIVKDGQRVYPTAHNLYYRGTGRESGTLMPFPMGLQHIRQGVTGYRCLNSNITRAGIPADCAGAGMEMSTYFPQCWDGKDVVGSPLGTCGPDYPVNVPQLQVLTLWPAAAVGGAVDPDAGGMHTDYLFGVHPFAFGEMMQKCIFADKKCRVRDNGDVYDFSSKAVVIPAGAYP